MERYDVVVIGGGAAGLSAAVTLGRSRRSVLVVDAGAPRNAPAAGVHGFLTRDGLPPDELVRLGREEVERYGGVVVDDEVVAARPGFEVDLAGGRTVAARRLVVATGLVDELPEVEGLAERWGDTVVHCPYCHGWEVRDRSIGVLGWNAMAVHQALLFRQLSDDVVLFHHGGPGPDDDEAARLAARGIRIVRGPVRAFDGSAVHLADGTVVPREVVTVATRMTARAGFLADLGLGPAEHPFGEHLPATDPTGRTSVPGVWVAGNVTDLAAQVVGAAAQGVLAGAHANSDLALEDAELAAAELQDRFTTRHWDERYGSRERVWSGRANASLAAQVEGLAPGRALDVGCGEGGDAVWLAAQGWEVLGVDVSSVALDRAAATAAAAGVADRATWEQVDARTWVPVGTYDLVTSSFLHLAPAERDDLHRRVAAAVRPGGSLVVVGHGPDHLVGHEHRATHAGLLFRAADVVAVLDPEAWDVLAADDGHDVVVHLRRRR